MSERAATMRAILDALADLSKSVSSMSQEIKDLRAEVRAISGAQKELVHLQVQEKLETKRTEQLEKKAEGGPERKKMLTKAVTEVFAGSLQWVEIQLVEGKNFAAMDKTGTSDPYGKVMSDFNHQRFKSSIVYGTLAPKWENEKFRFFYVPRSGTITFTFFDIDKFKEDDLLGELTLRVPDITKDKTVDKWFDLANEPTKTKGAAKAGVGQVHLIITNGGALSQQESFKSMIRQGSVNDAYMIDTFYTLGEGSFGVVYKGRAVKDGREVAVKKLYKDGLNTESAELLETEVRLMKRLSHPHVVEFIDVFEDSDNLFIVQEFIGGGELAALSRLDEADAATYMKQILRAVRYLHSQGVVHRDLKPQNVLLGGRHGEKAKLIDFGLSKDFGKKQEKVPAYPIKGVGAAEFQLQHVSVQLDLDWDLTGELNGLLSRGYMEVAGTAEYMAPELFDGTPYDSSVDMWACGVIAYNLLCSFLPWTADPLGEPEEMLSQIKSAKIDETPEEWTAASEDARDFIKCLIVLVPSSRLTANQAMGHPWILSTSKTRGKHSRRLDAYRKFQSMDAKDE